MGTIFVDKLDPQSGTSLEIGSSGDTITIPSGATITNNGTQTGFGGTNTPAFFVTYSSGQTLNSGASTKLNFDSEVYDTNSAYDNSTNYRFTVPSGQAGKYYIGLNIQFYDQQSRMNRMISEIHLNGTKVRENDDYGTQDKVFGNSTCDTFFNLSVGDYLEAYAYGETGDGGTFAVNGGTSNLRSFFGGYKIIE